MAEKLKVMVELSTGDFLMAFIIKQMSCFLEKILPLILFYMLMTGQGC